MLNISLGSQFLLEEWQQVLFPLAVFNLLLKVDMKLVGTTQGEPVDIDIPGD